MECNKDEALRAKQIAENRMQSGDFVGALKLAMKAQKLFPETQNITQILTVCEVHCAAQNKLSGSDMDWYGILLTQRFSDEATIKKQYRKLALLLHPDKNKSAGAEAAFKLIGEANRVLSDQTMRISYDMRIRGLGGTTAPKLPPHPSDSSGAKGDVNAKNFQNSFHSHSNTWNSYQRDEQQTFWTSCQHCNTRYRYYRTIVNATLRCQQCSQPFTAHEMGYQGAPPRNTWSSFNNHKDPPMHVPPKEASKSNGGKPYGKGLEDKFVRSCPVSMTKCTAGDGVSGKVRKSKDGHGVAGATKAGVGTSNPATSKARESQTPKNVGSKRARQSASDSRNDNKAGNGNDVKDRKVQENIVDPSGFDAGVHSKRSSRKKQHVSSTETAGDGDNYSPLKSNLPPSFELSCPDPDFGDFEKDKAEDCFAANQFWAIYDNIDGMPRFYAVIKKVDSPFKLRYGWLEPDPHDEGEKKWHDAGLPVACGKYRLGHYQKTRSVAMFSHQVHCIQGSKSDKGCYWVYPKKGETWAIFRHWDIGWSSNPKNHSEYQFEYVEVVSDFDENDGVKVTSLGKVKGFVSLFQKTVQNGISSFWVPPNELYRFSHRIPSFKMAGDEREGVPRGSFEFDPAGLPFSLFEAGDPGDVKTEVGMLNNQESSKRKVHQAMSNESIHKAKLHESNGAERVSPIIRRSPRSNAKSMDNGQPNPNQYMFREDGKNIGQKGYSQPEGTEAAACQTNENFKTPQKHAEKIYHRDTLKVRRSPRNLSKKNGK